MNKPKIDFESIIKRSEEHTAAAMDIGPNPTIAPQIDPPTEPKKPERKTQARVQSSKGEPEQAEKRIFMRIGVDFDLYYDMNRYARSHSMGFHQFINDALREHMERVKQK